MEDTNTAWSGDMPPGAIPIEKAIRMLEIEAERYGLFALPVKNAAYLRDLPVRPGDSLQFRPGADGLRDGLIVAFRVASGRMAIGRWREYGDGTFIEVDMRHPAEPGDVAGVAYRWFANIESGEFADRAGMSEAEREAYERLYDRSRFLLHELPAPAEGDE